MGAVDTNLLVRLLARDDPPQVAAAESFVQEGAWVSHVVLAETTWVLASVYDLDRKTLGTAVEMLLDHTDLTLQQPDVVDAALQEFRSQPKVSFSDCLILAAARKAGLLPLGTFDRELGKLEGTELLKTNGVAEPR